MNYLNILYINLYYSYNKLKLYYKIQNSLKLVLIKYQSQLNYKSIYIIIGETKRNSN